MPRLLGGRSGTLAQPSDLLPGTASLEANARQHLTHGGLGLPELRPAQAGHHSECRVSCRRLVDLCCYYSLPTRRRALAERGGVCAPGIDPRRLAAQACIGREFEEGLLLPQDRNAVRAKPPWHEPAWQTTRPHRSRSQIGHAHRLRCDVLTAKVPPPGWITKRQTKPREVGQCRPAPLSRPSAQKPREARSAPGASGARQPLLDSPTSP